MSYLRACRGHRRRTGFVGETIFLRRLGKFYAIKDGRYRGFQGLGIFKRVWHTYCIHVSTRRKSVYYWNLLAPSKRKNPRELISPWGGSRSRVLVLSSKFTEKKRGRMEGGREGHTGSLIKIKRQDRATRSYRDPRQSSPISERFFFSLFSVFNVRSWLRNWLFHVWRISWRQIQVRIISVRLHFPSLFFFFSFFKYRKLSISEFSIRQIFRFFFDLQRDIVVTVFLVEFVKLYTGLFNATR